MLLKTLLCFNGKLVTGISLNRCLDVSTTKLSVRVWDRAQGAFRRSIAPRSEVNVIGKSIASDISIVEANVLGSVLENGALDENLGSLAGIDTIGEDTVIVA